jgi:hypothetical protein
MIPFFRKIRKKLADDNKPLKYTRYAIGEIVLVVIGILIALSINNWNEKRISRNKEVKYFEGIKSDLLADIISLDNHLKTRANKIESARDIIEHIEGKPIDDYVELNNKIFDIVASSHFKETNITFDELKSSGNLNIISNDFIKNTLLELQSLYGTNDASRAHELYDYNNYVSKPYFNTVDLYPSLLLSEKSQKKGNVKKEQIDELLKSIAFKNGCVVIIWMSQSYLVNFPIIKEKSLSIINLIDKDLEK